MGPAPARVSAADRREALLDAAVELLTEGELEVDDVTMDAVAERTGVSRPLVYKHFANRDELLAAVYQREAVHLHEALAEEVAAAPSVEAMFRTLIRGSLRATAERGSVFASLRSAGAWNRDLRREQRGRDAATVRAFAARATREMGIEPVVARATASMLLSLIDPVLAQWRRRPTEDQARFLEDTYVALVRGGLAALRADRDETLIPVGDLADSRRPNTGLPPGVEERA